MPDSSSSARYSGPVWFGYMDGGWLSALYQGRVAAAAINVVAKKPDDWAKGIILCGIVEFYAILSLLASVLLLMNAL